MPSVKIVIGIVLGLGLALLAYTGELDPILRKTKNWFDRASIHSKPSDDASRALINCDRDYAEAKNFCKEEGHATKIGECFHEARKNRGYCIDAADEEWTGPR